MKIDISQEFLNTDDSVAKNQDGKPLTLKDILIASLLMPGTSEGDKIKSYNLYRDIKKSKVGFVLWNAEDVAFLKKIVLSSQPTLVVGQAHEMLEREYVSATPASPPEREDVFSTPFAPVFIPTTRYEIVDGKPVLMAETP